MNSEGNKFSLSDYVSNNNFSFVFTAPFIYSLIFPIIVLHVFMEIYQRFCFPIYGIKLVKFKDYFNLDRVKICYLSLFEKFNCLYCDYANGCFAYVSEIAARTEKFWCPIKHNKKRKNTHNHYDEFIEYLDEDGFRENEKKLREK